MDRTEDRRKVGTTPEIGALKRAKLNEVEIAITRDEISALVDKFYERVWAHPRLGPIFSSRLENDRTAHLERMKQFWASVLLRTGEYHGRPVPKHKAITEAKGVDFAHWLELFRATAFELLEPETAKHVTAKAEQIATSLWLAMFGGVGERPPTWLNGPDYLIKHTQGEVREMIP